MIQAIVFDCDGLIIDTEMPYYEAFREVYQGHGVDLPLETYVQCVGSSFDQFNPYDYLEECIGRPIRQREVEQAVEEKRDERIAQQSLLPGVHSYLQDAKRMGLKVGLASSSSFPWVESHLKNHRIFDYFDTIQTGDQVTEVKPNPELYRRALRQLGVEGKEAIALEDSSNGLQAAKAAGMHTVVVPNAVTANLTFEGYDVRLRSLAEMPLAELIKKIERV